MNYSIQVVYPPAEEPVTVQELYDHLSLNTDADNDLLALYITAAREHFEIMTDGRVVLPTVFRQSVYDFCAPIRLARGDVLSVDSVEYYDATDTLQTLDDWRDDLTGQPGLVYMPTNNYPALSTQRTRPVVVEFTAGWAELAAVPKSVKLAIMLLAGHFYNQREAFTDLNLNEVPQGFQRVCDMYKTGQGVI